MQNETQMTAECKIHIFFPAYWSFDQKIKSPFDRQFWEALWDWWCSKIKVLKKIQVMSLVFRNFVFTFFCFVFVQSKRVVLGFYLPNSRFQWLFLVLFQEPAQDLTLFSSLKETAILAREPKSQLLILRAVSIFKVSGVKKIIPINDFIFLTHFEKIHFLGRWAECTAELLTRWFSSRYQIL